jgi:adenine-specific DNA-methyltransferase
MDKLKMHSPDITQQNIDKLLDLFPNCKTEKQDDNGDIEVGIDFDLLKQELSKTIVEGPKERYQLNWPGKKEAWLTANAPISKTLRPFREESVDFDTTENLFIEGDNLEALKLLQETYLGKVKMIYIDPPYNTGKDFIYADDFAESTDEYLQQSGQKDEEGNRLVANTDSNGRFHSDWLSMMYSRLKLARNLLQDDGAIVIHIDENEYPNLEKLLNKIFSEDNNLGTIVWDKRNPKGDATGVAQQHELISLYCKNREIFKSSVDFRRPKENAQSMLKKASQLVTSEGGITESARKKYKEWLKTQNFSGGDKAYCHLDDNGDIYRPVSMAWPNKKKAPDQYFIPLLHPITKKECPIPERGWRNPPETMAKLQKKGLILFGPDETTQPNRKYLLKENLYENVSSLIYHGGSDDALISDLEVWFDTPKVVEVSKKLIAPICKEDDIILDFFAGSSTTAHAVMELNAEDSGKRKFIMVQLPEECNEKSEAYKAGFKNISEISKQRIRNAGKKVLSEGNSEKPDIGFRVLKIDSSNMNEVHYSPDAVSKGDLLDQIEHIKSDRSAEDLLFQVMLDWGVDLSLPIHTKTIEGKAVYFVNDDDLAACFDREIDETLIKALAAFEPLRVVFRDDGFVSDSVKINTEQLFKQLSPTTDIKAI